MDTADNLTGTAATASQSRKLFRLAGGGKEDYALML
jgi:hypothetical protein